METITTRQRALERVRTRMLRYGAVSYTNEGLCGQCPLCGFGLIYRMGANLAVLECGGDCVEEDLWAEFGL